MSAHGTEAARSAAADAIVNLMGDPPSVIMRLVYRRLVVSGRPVPEGCTTLPDDSIDAEADSLRGRPEHELILGPASTPADVTPHGTSVALGASDFPSCAPGADAQIIAIRAYGSTGTYLWETRDVPGIIGAQADNVRIRWDSGGLSIGEKR